MHRAEGLHVLAEAIVQLGLTHSKVDFAPPSTIIDDRFFSLAGVGDEVPA